MKFSEIFFGGLLILIGILAILRSFDFNIPIFRVVIALIFIYIGISILFGNHFIFNQINDNTVLFGNSDMKIVEIEKDDEFNIIFSSGIVDLRKLDITETQSIEINTIFGSSEVLLNPDIPVDIEGSSAFASLRLPNGNSISFGDTKYKSANDESKPFLKIKSSSVFGSMDIRN
ncbi:MAG: hypothetical protein ACOCZT_02385 [Halanaerobiales bacterium]